MRSFPILNEFAEPDGTKSSLSLREPGTATLVAHGPRYETAIAFPKIPAPPLASKGMWRKTGHNVLLVKELGNSETPSAIPDHAES
mgnify:CR=1 FL=1